MQVVVVEEILPEAMTENSGKEFTGHFDQSAEDNSKDYQDFVVFLFQLYYAKLINGKHHPITND